MRSADRSPSFEKLSDADLDRLLEFERVERERLYRESPIWRAHKNRVLCICLTQGTALHVINGSGLNDFDVLTFFARSPSLDRRSVDSAFRAGRHRDFGRSRFGQRTDKEGRTRFPSFEGRNVDLFAQALPATGIADPMMGVPRTPASRTAVKGPSREFKLWVRDLWKRRAVRARRTAHSPPHKAGWLCIHRHEGRWNDPNAPYYGGLQMDIAFQRTYGPSAEEEGALEAKSRGCRLARIRACSAPSRA
jgi:hypothetical protein